MKFKTLPLVSEALLQKDYTYTVIPNYVWLWQNKEQKSISYFKDLTAILPFPVYVCLIGLAQPHTAWPDRCVFSPSSGGWMSMLKPKLFSWTEGSIFLYCSFMVLHPYWIRATLLWPHLSFITSRSSYFQTQCHCVLLSPIENIQVCFVRVLQ